MGCTYNRFDEITIHITPYQDEIAIDPGTVEQKKDNRLRKLFRNMFR